MINGALADKLTSFNNLLKNKYSSSYTFSISRNMYNGYDCHDQDIIVLLKECLNLIETFPKKKCMIGYPKKHKTGYEYRYFKISPINDINEIIKDIVDFVDKYYSKNKTHRELFNLVNDLNSYINEFVFSNKMFIDLNEFNYRETGKLSKNKQKNKNKAQIVLEQTEYNENYKYYNDGEGEGNEVVQEVVNVIEEEKEN